MSDTHLAMMRKIKATLDPNHILNPGKIFSMGHPNDGIK